VQHNLNDFSVETARLLLVPITLNYAPQVFQVFDDSVTKYMFPSTPKKFGDIEEFIKSTLIKRQQGEEIVAVILKKDTFEYLGNCGLHHINTNTPELVIWVKKSAQGYGYGKEAVIGLKEWADQNIRYEYLVFPVGGVNIPSIKIPESLGGKVVLHEPKANQVGIALKTVAYHIYPTQ
jgi:RimJ/RimL family protein N-acetyltransferase